VEACIVKESFNLGENHHQEKGGLVSIGEWLCRADLCHLAGLGGCRGHRGKRRFGSCYW